MLNLTETTARLTEFATATNDQLTDITYKLTDAYEDSIDNYRFSAKANNHRVVLCYYPADDNFSIYPHYGFYHASLQDPDVFSFNTVAELTDLISRYFPPKN